jgi:hypothetical protein
LRQSGIGVKSLKQLRVLKRIFDEVLTEFDITHRPGFALAVGISLQFEGSFTSQIKTLEQRS